eukprot:18239-Heterococcus_DN1.PRE.1
MLRAVNGSSLLHIDVCLLALQQGFLPIASAAVAALESSIERTHTMLATDVHGCCPAHEQRQLIVTALSARAQQRCSLVSSCLQDACYYYSGAHTIA